MKVGIVAFGFAVPETVTSNKQIAEMAEELAALYSAPIFTQYVVKVVTHADVTNADDRPNDPPPTLRIARKAVAWAVKRGIEKLFVVAAAPHEWRSMRDMCMAVKESGASIKLEYYERAYDFTASPTWR